MTANDNLTYKNDKEFRLAILYKPVWREKSYINFALMMAGERKKSWLNRLKDMIAVCRYM